MVVKFTHTVVKLIPFGACSLVGVSAEFGTLGGMLIDYSRYVHHWSVRLDW